MKIRSITFCEHVRIEQGNKLTICGVYTGGLSSVASALPTLILLIQVDDAVSVGPIRLAIEVKCENLLVHAWVNELSPCVTSHNLIIHYISPFMIPRSGVYEFKVKLADGAGEIEVTQNLDVTVGGTPPPAVIVKSGGAN